MRLPFIIIFAIILIALPLIAEAVKIESPLKSDKIEDIIKAITSLLKNLAILIGGIMIIISGIQYMTSAGSEERVTKAKKTILYTIIGVAIVVSVDFIVGIIQELLGGLK